LKKQNQKNKNQIKKIIYNKLGLKNEIENKWNIDKKANNKNYKTKK
jgi:hypothetical protein